MEALFFIVPLVLFAMFVMFVVLPMIVFRRMGEIRERLEQLEDQVERMRQRMVAARAEAVERETREAELAAAAPAAATPAAEAAAVPQAEPSAPAPMLFPPAATPFPPVAAAATPPAESPSAPAAPRGRFDFPPPPGPRPESGEPAAAPPPRPEPAGRAEREEPAPMDARTFEQLVGGVWLQNLGSVVLLLGVFLMIVWGYTTGRFGPGVLVVAGVLLGLALVWRGDRVARRTPAFGHALIGVGLGAVYVTLYLGYLQLHVLSAGVALVLLVLLSLATVAAGLRYRVQAIAAFGVIGAFLPQFMARWLGLAGFSITPGFLLGYLAAVDLVVFALAARAGWSGLDLVALLLSALTWMVAFPTPTWGWPGQIGLAALFTVLGLAPLPRLARVEGRLRPLDIGVVAVAPLTLLAASAPFLTWAERGPVAALLFALGAVMLGAALWVDARRPERDLWMPLTAAATIYATGGVERAIGPVYTTLAWTAEGVVLLALGLRPRGGWMRAMGHLVLGLAICSRAFGAVTGLRFGAPPLAAPLGPDAWRDLGCVALLLLAGWMLGRKREQLVAIERRAVDGWTLAGHAWLASWSATQASRFAADLVQPGGWFDAGPPPVGVSVSARAGELASALSACAWLAQAAHLAWRGARAGVVRGAAAVLLGALAGILLFSRGDAGWWTDQPAFVAPLALLSLAAIALVALISRRQALARPQAGSAFEEAAEAWGTGACLLLAVWMHRESHHLATLLVRPHAAYGMVASGAPWERETALAATFAAVLWLAQAAVLAWRGALARGAYRVVAAGLGLCALFLLGLQGDGGRWDGPAPLAAVPVLLSLAAVALMAVVALRQAAARPGRESPGFRAAEIWAVAANLLLMVWSRREGHHLAESFAAPPGEGGGADAWRRVGALAAAFCSAAWLVQAVALLALGWLRDSAFVRWCGLSLLGLTLFKFLLFDLQTVDVFWRFLTAIAVGAAMLAFSYAYQRRSKAAKPEH